MKSAVGFVVCINLLDRIFWLSDFIRVISVCAFADLKPKKHTNRHSESRCHVRQKINSPLAGFQTLIVIIDLTFFYEYMRASIMVMEQGTLPA